MHICIDIYTFIRETRQFIRCKYSVTNTTLMKVADLPAEASTGVLQNFRPDSECSTALDTVDCESHFPGSKLEQY